MKKLLLLRHAKSGWDDNLDDHERPLNARGKKAAPRMGKLLREQRLRPDLIVTSTATRALKTARVVAEACGYEGPVQQDRSLYLASPAQYVRVAQNVDDGVVCLLLVGHNPGIELLVEQLTGIPERMPTAALCLVNVPIAAWCAFDATCRCSLQRVWRPKQQR
ncbi:MAG: histidine phosphatase family protein [Polyangiaceae bacterium]|jgi:phosphohistidine phosphatase|nr:histidine phosphatase family protein [Polyangiaceae bacterium]